MSLDPISAVSDLATSIISRIWPDATEKEKAQLALQQLQQSGELQKMAAEVGLLQGQIDINKAEAANPSVFVAGWRPAIGWVGALSLACIYIPKALLLTGVWVYLSVKAGQLLPAPDLGVSDLLGLLGSILGIGTMRTVEKRAGVATVQTVKR